MLLSEAGKDATYDLLLYATWALLTQVVASDAFEDVGHSDEAREIMHKYLVGTADVRLRIQYYQSIVLMFDMRGMNRTPSLDPQLEKLEHDWIKELLQTLSKEQTEGSSDASVVSLG